MKQALKTLALSISVVALIGSLTGQASAQTSTGAAAPGDGNSITIVVPVFGISMVINLVTNQAGEFMSADITPTAPAAPAAPAATITDPITGETSPVPAGQPVVFDITFDRGSTSADASIRLDDAADSAPDATTAASAGEAQWVGDPLGNGDIVVVGYTAGTDSTGALTITIDSINGSTPAAVGTVESAGEITWYQVLAPVSNAGHVYQFITFFDAPADPAAQLSTNLTFDVTAADSQNGVSVSLTDPNAADTISGIAKPSRGEHEGEEHEGEEHEHEEHEHEEDD